MEEDSFCWAGASKAVFCCAWGESLCFTSLAVEAVVDTNGLFVVALSAAVVAMVIAFCTGWITRPVWPVLAASWPFSCARPFCKFRICPLSFESGGTRNVGVVPPLPPGGGGPALLTLKGCRIVKDPGTTLGVKGRTLPTEVVFDTALVRADARARVCTLAGFSFSWVEEAVWV